ncbi:unknown similar to AMEV049 [Choristoneura biennis entomopoxvirus]|uniref:Uncharacterized protein n=1 Tax=Choristoneura biennis entomopoxvirus TaxID=10288 RepID=A0A916KPE6_CBEPV|nr:unknown similar to AMEV049 [Choristoneura biennis entomopoxvirus]CCU55638.1 unknown similar to AMEV049 [Choristoneura biennis entomopoxvirus]
MLISGLMCKCGCNNYFIIDIDFINDDNCDTTAYNLFYYEDYYILKKIYIIIYYIEMCDNFINYFKYYDSYTNKYFNMEWYIINWKKIILHYDKNIYIKYFDVYKKQDLICLCKCNDSFKIKYYIYLFDTSIFYRLYFTITIEYKYKICYNFIRYFKLYNDYKKNLLDIHIDKIMWKPNIYYIQTGS